MSFCKTTKAIFRTPDSNIDSFDGVARVFEGDIFALYMFIIYLDYILRTKIDLMKEKGFTFIKRQDPDYISLKQ